MIRFIELFAGIGGFRKAIEPLGGKCVFACEIDRPARKTYEANFWGPDPYLFGHDVRVFSGRPDLIRAHDLLTAGFPCQPFSRGGTRQALGDDRGMLFFDIVKILSHHRPRAFLLENVPHLQNIEDGKVMALFCDTLRQELGYQLTVEAMNSYPFVPQKRKRLFFVGFRDPNGFTFGDIEVPDQTPTFGQIRDRDAPASYTLIEKHWRRASDRKGNRRNGFGYHIVDDDGIAPTLVASNDYWDMHPIFVDQPGKNPRELTPRECSRLMGFDSFQGSEYRIVYAKSSSYKMFGNAVVVPQVRAIVKAMMAYMK